MSNRIPAKTISVWFANSDLRGIDQEEMYSALPVSEQSHASALKEEHDKVLFIQRCFILRKILSFYCSCKPSEIDLAYSDFKKPFIKDPSSFKCQFNLTHSGIWMAVAVTKQVKIGIDLEEIKTVENMEEVARNYFSSGEFHAFLNSTHPRTTFFKIWTRKEAFMKGLGLGFFYPVSSFSVADMSGLFLESPMIHDNDEDGNSWQLIELETPPGYAGSLAVKAKHMKIEYHSFDDWSIK